MKILKNMPPDYNNIEYMFVSSYAVLLATQTLQHELSLKEMREILCDAEFNLREALKLLHDQTAPRMEVKFDIHFLIGRIIFERMFTRYKKIPEHTEEYMKEICVNLEIANKGISQIISSLKKKKDDHLLKPLIEKQIMILLFSGMVTQKWSNLKQFKWEPFTLNAQEMYKRCMRVSKTQFEEMYFEALKNLGFLQLDWMNRKRNEIPMNRNELEKVFKQCEETWEQLCRANPEDPQMYIMWALAIYEYTLVLLPTANLLPIEQHLHYRFAAPWYLSTRINDTKT
jgi:hypothetical protein